AQGGGEAVDGRGPQHIARVWIGLVAEHPGGGCVEDGGVVGGAHIGHRGGGIVDPGDGDRDGGAGAAAVAVRGGVAERVERGGPDRERVEHPVRVVAVGAVGVHLQQRPGGEGDGVAHVAGQAVARCAPQHIARARIGVVAKHPGGGHVEDGVLVGGAHIGTRVGGFVDPGDGDRDGGAGAAAVAVRGGVAERVERGGPDRERVEHPVRVVARSEERRVGKEGRGRGGAGVDQVGGQGGDRRDPQHSAVVRSGVVAKLPGGGHVEDGGLVGGAEIGVRGGGIVVPGDGDRDGGAGAAAVAVRGGVAERVERGGPDRERVEHPVRVVA